MTWHPNEVKENLKWKQAEIVIRIMQEFPGVTFDVMDIQQHMIALGYPPRKYKKDTLQAVLSRLARQGRINRSARGEYYMEAA